jgi:molybdopterin molybdotransferase
MPEFLHLLSPKEAFERLLPYLNLQSQTELVELNEALGRVTSADILAPHSLPSFARSTMDGYAVMAADTYGASDSIPDGSNSRS